MDAVAAFLTFLWTSYASPQGVAVGATFAALVWAYAGIQTLMIRHAERVHRRELERLVADMPTPDRTAKRLVPDYLQEPRRAA